MWGQARRQGKSCDECREDEVRYMTPQLAHLASGTYPSPAGRTLDANCRISLDFAAFAGRGAAHCVAFAERFHEVVAPDERASSFDDRCSLGSRDWDTVLVVVGVLLEKR